MRRELELSLEGKTIQVVFKGAQIGLRGQLLGWDPSQRILIIKEMADNNVLTTKNCVILMENVLWFSFEGEIVMGMP